MAMTHDWIRRDRETGQEEPIRAWQVVAKLRGYYRNVPDAMAAASRELPLTTGMADYYPERR